MQLIVTVAAVRLRNFIKINGKRAASFSIHSAALTSNYFRFECFFYSIFHFNGKNDCPIKWHAKEECMDKRLILNCQRFFFTLFFEIWFNLSSIILLIEKENNEKCSAKMTYNCEIYRFCKLRDGSMINECIENVRIVQYAGLVRLH